MNLLSKPQNYILRSRNQASDESTQLRVTRVFFLPLISPNFDDQLSSNVPSLLFCAYYRCTKWEDWSLTTTKGVQKEVIV